MYGREAHEAPAPRANRREAEQFVLGGYFALKHYLDYRDTGDVDAWWRSRQDAHALAVAREVFAETAAEFGYSVRERTWGETISLEALDGANKADDARVRVQTHLARIEARMPIERLSVERRAAAAELRRWYRDEFTAPPVVGRGERRHDSEEPPQ